MHTSCRSGWSFVYEKHTWSSSSSPRGAPSAFAPGASGSSSAASMSASRRRADANAVWTCVTTAEISLNGFMYWFAYERKLCTWPTVSGVGQPVMTLAQPAIATAAYVMLFTSLVDGLLRLLTNCACTPFSYSRAFTRPNAATSAGACANAVTSFWLPMTSSAKPPSSPWSACCAANDAADLRVMMPAASTESGVSRMTTSATGTEMESMNAIVPTMVATPLNSCVKPCSRPSLTWSTSFMTRDSRSPWECESTNESGRRSSFPYASTRRSRAVLYERRFVQ